MAIHGLIFGFCIQRGLLKLKSPGQLPNLIAKLEIFSILLYIGYLMLDSFPNFSYADHGPNSLIKCAILFKIKINKSKGHIHMCI